MIKQIREEVGMSLKQLEEETGIDRHYLSDIEEGNIPEDEILFSEMFVISRALGKTIEDLFKVKYIKIK